MIIFFVAIDREDFLKLLKIFKTIANVKRDENLFDDKADNR